MKNISQAITVVGLAAISVWSWHISGGRIGSGWGFLAVLVLFFGSEREC